MENEKHSPDLERPVNDGAVGDSGSPDIPKAVTDIGIGDENMRSEFDESRIKDINEKSNFASKVLKNGKNTAGIVLGVGIVLFIGYKIVSPYLDAQSSKSKQVTANDLPSSTNPSKTVQINGASSAAAEVGPESIGGLPVNPDAAALAAEQEKLAAQNAQQNGNTHVPPPPSLEKVMQEDGLPPLEDLNKVEDAPAVAPTKISENQVKNTVAFLSDTGKKEQEKERRNYGWFTATSNAIAAKDNTSQQASPDNAVTPSVRLAQMGETCAGVVETQASNYQPNTPVKVRILSCKNGKARDISLLGTFVSANEKLIISLSKGVTASGIALKGVNAVLVDKTNRQAGISSNVDGHYFKRYGLLAASAWLNGLVKASREPSQVIYPTTTSQPVVIQSKSDSPEREAAAETLLAISNDIRSSKGIPNESEVIVNRGELVGVMFLDNLDM